MFKLLTKITLLNKDNNKPHSLSNQQSNNHNHHLPNNKNPPHKKSFSNNKSKSHLSKSNQSQLSSLHKNFNN